MIWDDGMLTRLARNDLILWVMLKQMLKFGHYLYFVYCCIYAFSMIFLLLCVLRHLSFCSKTGLDRLNIDFPRLQRSGRALRAASAERDELT